MIYGSVCSGIEAASVAWNPLGWKAAWVSEIEKFPSKVLAVRHPYAPNFGDMNRLLDLKEIYGLAIRLLVGGTPCQPFSVAGFRKGLADPRGNLTLVYLSLLDRLRPDWMVWENVPGVLQNDGGRAFGTFLGGLAKLGYGFAYRVLDAQYVRVESHSRAVPQRRRRVFVVGYLGDWRRAAAVLFERESLLRHSPPSRKAWSSVTGSLSARTQGGGGLGSDFECDGGLVAKTLLTKTGASLDTSFDTYVAHTLRAEGFDASEDGTGRGTPLIAIPFDTTQITHPENRSNPRPGDPAPSLSQTAHAPAIVFSCKDYGADAGEIAPTLRAMGFAESHANGGGQLAITSKSGVRRLTPRECERLQGFPDGYLTDIVGTKDGPIYKALGNSMAVNVMRWIGERIDAVDRIGGAA